MNEGAKLIGGLLLIMSCLFLVGLQINSEESRIRAWAKEHKCVVLESELCTFNRGPFVWYDDDYHAYRTEMAQAEGKRVVWFYFGLFGMEVKE